MRYFAILAIMASCAWAEEAPSGMDTVSSGDNLHLSYVPHVQSRLFGMPGSTVRIQVREIVKVLCRPSYIWNAEKCIGKWLFDFNLHWGEIQLPHLANQNAGFRAGCEISDQVDTSSILLNLYLPNRWKSLIIRE